jgi:hypothetical protein
MFIAARITRGSTGTDSGIAAAYVSVVIGILGAVLGFVLVWVLARRFLTPGLMRPVQIGDAVLIIGWAFAWNRFMGPTPKFEYSGQRPVLEVEARLSDSLLEDSTASEVAIEFAGGEDLSLPHPEVVRHEGGFTVLPWETTPIRVRAWEVRVLIHDTPSLFRLDLPKRPDASTQWSEWIAPSAAPDFDVPKGLFLRYRFRLIPSGAAPP